MPRVPGINCRPMRGCRLTLTGLLVAGICAAAAPLASVAAPRTQAKAATPASSVPAGFVGMNVTAPVYPTAPLVVFGQQLSAMVSSGVESIRLPVYWGEMQTRRNGPIHFRQLDQVVALCVARRLTIMMTVLGAPGWDAVPGRGQFNTPRAPGPYASFIVALIHRYGPRGTFWRSHAQNVPVRMWQVWNEPNLKSYWPQQPFAARYVALLRAAHAAIKRADPGATVVLAGLPNASWYYLARIYSAGGRNQFDEVAIHPYTASPKGVITILTYVRRVMNQNRDRRTPILATEIGWPGGLGVVHRTYGIATTQAGQASKWRGLVPMLLRSRRALGLRAFYYYDWASTDDPRGDAFAWAGLYLYSFGVFLPKPAASVFKGTALAMEHCRVKGTVATRCQQAG
jgi:hypothetical protein